MWGIPVHGGRPGVDDVVTRLQQWLRLRRDDDYLAVHQRLDRDASGVLLFVRSRHLNAAVADAFREHSLRRCYIAWVKDGGLPDQCTLVDHMVAPTKGQSRIVTNGGVVAESQVKVLKRSRGLALVELTPKTGRRHQLRLQLAHRQCPIVGDTLYAGPPGPRLMLHATSLELFALKRQFSAPLPSEFANADALTSLGDAARVRQSLLDAGHRRASLLAPAFDVVRLVNDAGDGLSGIRVDRYGDFAVLELTGVESQARRAEIVAAVHALGARGVYVKCRVRADLRGRDAQALAPSTPDIGEPAPEFMVVNESEFKFETCLADGWDTGLYVDQRDNRQRVFGEAKGKHVLNLFCYTGSFTVAASLGGAYSTTSVDISRRALNRAQRNLVLNGIALDGTQRLLRADALQFARRAVARGETYDLVIVDPPSFATLGTSRVFSLESSWDTLIELIVSLLPPRGQCLFVSHEIAPRARQLRHRIQQVLERVGRVATVLRDLPAAADCPPGHLGPCPSRSIWLRLE